MLLFIPWRCGAAHRDDMHTVAQQSDPLAPLLADVAGGVERNTPIATAPEIGVSRSSSLSIARARGPRRITSRLTRTCGGRRRRRCRRIAGSGDDGTGAGAVGGVERRELRGQRAQHPDRDRPARGPSSLIAASQIFTGSRTPVCAISIIRSSRLCVDTGDAAREAAAGEQEVERAVPPDTRGSCTKWIAGSSPTRSRGNRRSQSRPQSPRRRRPRASCRRRALRR